MNGVGSWYFFLFLREKRKGEKTHMHLFEINCNTLRLGGHEYGPRTVYYMDNPPPSRPSLGFAGFLPFDNSFGAWCEYGNDDEIIDLTLKR